jgi:hypothetical protein
MANSGSDLSLVWLVKATQIKVSSHISTPIAAISSSRYNQSQH